MLCTCPARSHASEFVRTTHNQLMLESYENYDRIIGDNRQKEIPAADIISQKSCGGINTRLKTKANPHGTRANHMRQPQRSGPIVIR